MPGRVVLSPPPNHVPDVNSQAWKTWFAEVRNRIGEGPLSIQGYGEAALPDPKQWGTDSTDTFSSLIYINKSSGESVLAYSDGTKWIELGTSTPSVDSDQSNFTVNFFAGEFVSARKVVYIDSSGSIKTCSSDTLGTRNAIGITKNSYSVGELATVYVDGIIEDSTWSWPPGSPLFVGADGALTSTPPTSGYILLFAFAISKTKISIHKEPSVKLSKVLASYEQAVLTSGPLVYYKLDETSGMVAADSSGNGNDGTYTGGVTLGQETLVEGEPFSASFDGTDDYVAGPSLGAIVYPVTLEVWIDVASLNNSAPLISTHNHDDAYYGLSLAVLSTGAVTIRAGDGAGKGAENRVSLTSDPLISLNTTYHLAAVARSETDVAIYVNGSLVAPLTLSGTGGTMSTSAGLLRVGEDTTSNTLDLYFNGFIDEPAIYTRELSDQEIADHYNAGIGA